MPIKRNMTLNEIIDYLKNDLRQSVINDVEPCFHGQGGYFGVPRLILSYIDYLGALYHGYFGRKKGNRRILADHTYAKTLLRNIFGSSNIDPNYKTYGELLWEIYRNGTIHLYEPLKLRSKTEIITWLTYKGPRTAKLRSPYNFQATHLIPHDNLNNTWFQPVSITCLYEDLLVAIDEYSNLIAFDKNLETNFVQTADALQDPEQTNLQWW